MKALKITFAFFVIAVIGVYFLFNRSTFFDGSRLDHQISQLIKQKDTGQIKRIAGDQPTYHFLMDLPKDTKPAKTSGNQGSNGKSEYFITVLDGKKVDVLLKQSFQYGGLIKKVELSQMSLQ